MKGKIVLIIFLIITVLFSSLFLGCYPNGVPIENKKHQFDAEGYCPYCGTTAVFSDGMAFSFVESEGYYEVSDNPHDIVFKIEIPATFNGYPVKVIPYGAFENCILMSSITISEGIVEIGECAFSHTGLVEINLPDSLIKLGKSAFELSDKLVTVNIGKNLMEVLPYTFWSTKISQINVSSENLFLKSIDGNLYNKSGTTMYNYAYNKSAETFTVPPDVTKIGAYCFNYATNLKQIILPNTLISIEEYAFYCCTSLESIDIPNSVIEINGSPFSFCDSLETVVFGKGITVIDNCFLVCDALTTLIIPINIVRIEEELPDNIKDIYYEGTEEQWGYVFCRSGEELEGVTVHYNYVIN